MRDDQHPRLLGIALATTAYIARLMFVGNGPIQLFSYEAEPFALLLVTVVLLALPETIDMLPFGPTRTEK